MEGVLASRIRSNPSDDSKLLLLFVSCDELKAMRIAPPPEAEARFNNYGLVAVVAFNGKVAVLADFNRAQYIQSTFSTLSFGLDPSNLLKPALSKLQDLTKMSGFKVLGPIGIDSNAVYAGAITRPGKDNHYRVAVEGSTLVKGCQVIAYLYSRLDVPDDLSLLLARQKTYLADIIAAND